MNSEGVKELKLISVLKKIVRSIKMSEYYPRPPKKIWNKAKMSTPTTTVKYSNGRTSQIIRQGKEIKDI